MFYVYHYNLFFPADAGNDAAIPDLHPLLRKNWKIKPDLSFMDAVVKELEAHHVKFAANGFSPSVSLDISDGDAYFGTFREMIEKYGKDGKLRCSLTFQSPVYTEEECLNADWLSIRSLFYAFDPTPSDRQPLADGSVSLDRCPRQRSVKHPELPPVPGHFEQVRPFWLGRKKQWGNRCFASTQTYPLTLLCSDRAKELLERELNGIKFLPTYTLNGKEPRPDVFQIVPINTLPEEAFDAASEGKTYRCNTCGMKMFTRADSTRPVCYGVRAEYLDKSADFYLTLPCIDEVQNGFAESMIILSQRAYRFLCEKQMIGGLEIQPLKICKQIGK